MKNYPEMNMLKYMEGAVTLLKFYWSVTSKRYALIHLMVLLYTKFQLNTLGNRKYNKNGVSEYYILKIMKQIKI